MKNDMDGCSVSWLVEHSILTREDVVRALVENRIGYAKEQGDMIVPRQELPRLIEILGKDVPRRFWPYPAFLTEQGVPWRRVLQEMYAEEAACPASISPAQGEFVRSLILNLAPENALEIGCFIGVSTMWILGAMEEVGKGMLHTVDLFHDKTPFGRYTYLYFPDVQPYLERMIAKAGLSHRSRLHQGDSKLIGREYAERIGCELDFLFIDGDHSVEGCSTDFLLYSPFVRPGGIIMLHDTNLESGWDGPRWTIDHIVRKNPGVFDIVEFVTSPQNYGMAIIRRK